MSEFEELRNQIVLFMRGNYKLDEVAGMYYDVPCVRFRQGKKTLVTIKLQKGYYDFLIVFGQAEREKFEAVRNEFPIELQELYDKEPTLKDGKWLTIKVDHLEMFSFVKKLLLIKKNPNRKPFRQEGAVVGKCGHRCDFCVHYTGTTDEQRAIYIPHLDAVYGQNSDWSMRCTGCDTPGCHCVGEGKNRCDALQCLMSSNMTDCLACGKYPCEKSTVGYRQLEQKSISADDVTYAVLPFVPEKRV